MKKTMLHGLLIGIFSLSAMADNYVEYDITFNQEPSHSGINVNHTDISRITSIGPAMTKEGIFKECILRSDKILTVMDSLKKLPEESRVEQLLKSNLWATLDESHKDQLIVFLAQLSNINDSKYIIIKGKMANQFKTECTQLIK